MLAALKEFTGLPHRAALVGEVAGVRYVERFQGHQRRRDAGRGGRLRGSAAADRRRRRQEPGLHAAARRAGRQGAAGADHRARCRAHRGRAGGVCPTERCASLEEAVVAAARAARPGDTVLLSPACASLDMFRDYAAARRGVRRSRCGDLRHERRSRAHEACMRYAPRLAWIRCCRHHGHPAAGPGDGDLGIDLDGRARWRRSLFVPEGAAQWRGIGVVLAAIAGHVPTELSSRSIANRCSLIVSPCCWCWC